MTYVVTKIIKGNPYLYEVRSEREGDRVRQVFVRYLGRAGSTKAEARAAEIGMEEAPERIAPAPRRQAVAPTVAVEAETPTLVERTGQEMRAIRDRLQGERMGWQVPKAEFISIESEVSGSPITPDFSESMVDTHKSLIQRAIREGEEVPAEVLRDYPDLTPKPAPTAVETTPTPVTKEPWEMTKAERATYIEQKGKESIQKWNESGGKGFPPSNPERWGVSEVNKAADELGMPWGEGRVAIPQHKYEVMVALKQGKTIPSEVLKDYPELTPKPTPEVMVTPGSLGQKHGIEVEVVKGQEGGEWAGGIARVGDDTNLMNYRAGDWTSTKADDFVSQKQYPGNVVSAAHEIAHGLFTQNPEKAHRALQELQKLGVPENVAFESLVDLGGLYLLEPSSIANTELRSVVETWLEKKPAPPVEEEPAVAPTAPVTPENKLGERKFIGITRETDPTQKRAPWRVAYERAGKEYAHHLSSQNQAIQYAKERLGVAVDPKTLKPVTPTAPVGEPVPEITPITPSNPYMNMPIERVRRDATHGVKLAKEALAVREAVTPEVIPVTPEVTKEFPPYVDNYRKPLTTYTDTLYHETDIEGLYGLTPQTTGHWHGDTYFANTPELALGQGTSKGVHIKFSAEGIEGQLNRKPVWEMLYKQNQAEFIDRHPQENILKKNIKEVTIDANITGNRGQRIAVNRWLSSWDKTVNPDGSITYRPAIPKAEVVTPNDVTPEVTGLLKWYKEPGGAWQADAIDNIEGKEQVIEVYKDTETGEWKWTVSDRQRNYLRSGISQSEEEAKATAKNMWYKQPKAEEPEKPRIETTPSIKEIQYSRDLDIRNIEALPRGTGAKYLITLKGQDDELIAKQWARVKPASLKPDEVLVSMTPVAEKPEPTTIKKPWQMTKSEYRLAENEPRVEAIKQAITQGKPIVLATHTRAVKIANPEHIRITSTGEVQIPQGRKWIYLTDDQIVNLAKQAGIEPVPFEEKVYHHAEVKQALSEGKEVSDDILKDYPDLKREAKTFPRIQETVSGLKVRNDIPNMSSIESSLEDYEILEGIREIPTVDEGEITPPKFYSVEQERQTKELAEQIKTSGEITPLILVTEGDKDYILEGSHRYDALRLLGIKSFPALVVKNLSATPSESEE